VSETEQKTRAAFKPMWLSLLSLSQTEHQPGQ